MAWKTKVGPSLKSFYNNKEYISILNGILRKGDRIIVPTNVEKSEISSTWDTNALRSVSLEQENMSTGLVSRQKSKTELITTAPVLINATNCFLNRLYHRKSQKYCGLKLTQMSLNSTKKNDMIVDNTIKFFWHSLPQKQTIFHFYHGS